MDEWAVRGAVMKTGLGGKKVRVKGIGEQHERKGKVGYAERRTEIEKSSERWKKQREQDREKIGRSRWTQ